MNLYKRGQTWWIEYVRQGQRYRVSTHKKDKGEAKSVLALMQSGVSAKSPIAPLVASLCGFYGKSLRDVLPELCAAADTSLDEIKKEAKTALDAVFDVTVADGWSLYVSHMDALGLRPARKDTLIRRENEYKRFAAWLKDVAPLATKVRDVTGKTAMAYAVKLAESGKSTKTRKNILGELGTIWKIFEKAVNVENIWSNITPKDTDGKVGEAFTREEETKVFVAAQKVGKDWYEVCKLMRHTGLRYADVARLTWAEVDLDERMIHRVPTKTMRHGIAVHVPICESLRNVLASMKREGEYLFPLHAELYGNRGRAAREALAFGEVLALAGIIREGITVHSWRHTFITRMAEAGIDKETRKRLAGHTQDATSERYDHAKYFSLDMKAVEAAA